MPVDTSIYGQIAQPNPLGQMGQLLQAQTAMQGMALRQQEIELAKERVPLIAAQTQNALNQNALFNQQFVARQALGELAQSSVDPQTGQMDWNKYSLNISTDPRTAFMAREVIESLTRQKLLDAETFGKKLANTQAQLGLIGNTITPIAMDWAKNGAPADPKDPNKIDTSRLVNAAGLVVGQNPEMYDQVKNFLVGLRALPKDQATQAMMDFAKNVQVAKGGIDSVAPLFAQNVGSGTLFGQRDRFSGGATAGGYVPSQLTPAEAQAQVKTESPTGQPILQPRGAMPQVAAPGAPEIQPLSGAKPVATVPITGKPAPAAQQELPDSTVAAPAASGPSALTTGAPAGLATPAGPPKGVETAQNEVLTKYAPALQERASVANQLKLLMQQAQEETKNFKQGGGAETYMKMAQLAQALGVKDSAVDKLANGDLPSTQAANKLFMQVGSMIASQLIRAGGGRMTQTEWGKTLSEGAPNIDMDPRAIPKIFAAMREMVHYTNMENQAYKAKYAAYRNGGYDIGQFPADWQESLGTFLDARAKQKGLR